MRFDTTRRFAYSRRASSFLAGSLVVRSLPARSYMCRGRGLYSIVGRRPVSTLLDRRYQATPVPRRACLGGEAGAGRDCSVVQKPPTAEASSAGRPARPTTNQQAILGLAPGRDDTPLEPNDPPDEAAGVTSGGRVWSERPNDHYPIGRDPPGPPRRR